MSILKRLVPLTAGLLGLRWGFKSTSIELLPGFDISPRRAPGLDFVVVNTAAQGHQTHGGSEVQVFVFDHERGANIPDNLLQADHPLQVDSINVAAVAVECNVPFAGVLGFGRRCAEIDLPGGRKSRRKDAMARIQLNRPVQ